MTTLNAGSPGDVEAACDKALGGEDTSAFIGGLTLRTGRKQEPPLGRARPFRQLNSARRARTPEIERFIRLPRSGLRRGLQITDGVLVEQSR